MLLEEEEEEEEEGMLLAVSQAGESDCCPTSFSTLSASSTATGATLPSFGRFV